jgi:prephenate dehydratase
MSTNRGIPSGTQAPDVLQAGLRRVGFQGELGAFSEEAVRALVPGADPIPHSSFEAVLRAVEQGNVDAGAIPVENTLAGTVAAAYDALASGAVSVIAEVAIPIRLWLLGTADASVGGIREARSHPVALAQCRGFFEAHPDVLPQAVYDTAGAAKAVAASGDPAVAAIASRGAGTRYQLKVLRENLQDRDDNQTRFFLVVPDTASVSAPEGLLKTACVAEVENRPGILHALLGIFADRGLDLTHLASRPGGSPWTYRFIMELTHAQSNDAEEALAAASAMGAQLHVLGTFPAWKGPTNGPRTEVNGARQG